MSKMVALPGGQSAQLREPQDVSERLRRPIGQSLRRVRPEIQTLAQKTADLPDDPEHAEERKQAALELAQQISDEEADAYSAANDLAVVALVEQWSYPQPISLDGILDLPGRSYDKLREAVAPLVNELFVDTTPSPEKTSPFVNSNGSDTLSTEGSLTTSLTSGAHTASSSSPDGP